MTRIYQKNRYTQGKSDKLINISIVPMTVLVQRDEY